MPSPTESRSRWRKARAGLGAGLGMTLLACGCATAQAQASAPAAAPASQAKVGIEAIHQAAHRLQDDPNLPGMHTEREWRFKPFEDEAKKRAKPPSGDSAWLAFIEWLQESTRWLVWLLGAMVLIVVMLRAARVARLHADGQATRAALRPAEVGQLDIRPESLPANIGASARQLCQQGQAHAAMTLLYRGAISRLVHQHSVPIAAASTEGDCLRLARPLLAPEALGYFKRLVALWLRVAYGHVQALEDEVLALCDGFAAHLDGGLNPGGLQP